MTKEEAGQKFLEHRGVTGNKIDDRVEEVLAHFGVKGMKWGRRKNRDESPTEATINQTLTRKGKTKLKAEGGERQPASEDALAVAAARQKLHKSGTAALSNQELKSLETRLNLEVNVKRLDAEAGTSEGKKFVKDLFKDTAKDTGRQQTKRVASRKATKFVDSKVA